ncbi:MAG: PAS domain-containing protein [Deltaproteobacteria bacterium]|nr:PAS domain-containing protein [Deltaproteobacteria bacterium]
MNETTKQGSGHGLKPAKPTGIERTFADDEIIVSKTDTSGRLVYANDVFLRIAGYQEREILGQPHSIIRHPDMPRAVFSLLWETLASGSEIFAYVVNLARNGDHYWVFAHVTPTFGPDGATVGYHSSRRVPNRRAVATIAPIYAELLAAERAVSGKREQVLASRALLDTKLARMGIAYDALMFALETKSEA